MPRRTGGVLTVPRNRACTRASVFVLSQLLLLLTGLAKPGSRNQIMGTESSLG